MLECIDAALEMSHHQTHSKGCSHKQDLGEAVFPKTVDVFFYRTVSSCQDCSKHFGMHVQLNSKPPWFLWEASSNAAVSVKYRGLARHLSTLLYDRQMTEEDW